MKANDNYTIRQWLEMLPDGIKEMAIENITRDVSFMDNKEISFHRALSSAFVFEKTQQGHKYWFSLALDYDKKIEEMYSFAKEPFLQ